MRGLKLRIFHEKAHRFEYYQIGVDNDNREFLLITEDFHIIHTGINSNEYIDAESRIADIILKLNNNSDCTEVTIFDEPNAWHGRKFGIR